MCAYIRFAFVLFFFGQKITVVLHALTFFFHSFFFCLIIEQRGEIQSLRILCVFFKSGMNQNEEKYDCTTYL